jgi:hypothetical protein
MLILQLCQHGYLRFGKCQFNKQKLSNDSLPVYDGHLLGLFTKTTEFLISA